MHRLSRSFLVSSRTLYNIELMLNVPSAQAKQGFTAETFNIPLSLTDAIAALVEADDRNLFSEH